MNIQELYERLEGIKAVIKSKGVSGSAYTHVNWLGDEIRVTVEASDEYDKNGYWRREKHFSGKKREAEKLIFEAEGWAYAIPNEEDRVTEFAIQKLNEIVEKLPEGHSEIAIRAWEGIHKMLEARAQALAKNGLPSPTSISNIEDAKPRVEKTGTDDDIPF